MAINFNFGAGCAHLKRQYDKILAFLALALLFAALVYLAVRIGLIQSMKRDFDEEMASLRPRHERAAEVTPKVFEATSAALDEPAGVAYWLWTNVTLTIPERRVTCTDARCRKPVPYEATICPLCLSEQRADPVEVDKPKDSDGDGMLDEWELQYGLDPYDADDAAKDTDSDRHSNLDEFRAKTDPTDPDSRPSVIEQLRIEKVTSVRFGMLFKSLVKTPHGERFGLNYLDGDQVKTAFVAVGDTVAGFVVSNYVHKVVEVEVPFKRKDDVSELTLVRGDHTVTLVRNQPFKEIELTAHLVLSFDGSRYQGKQGEFITVDGLRCEIMEIDRGGERVVLRLDGDSEKTVVVTRRTEPH